MAKIADAAVAETTTELTFSVDAALLAELGERLVGEPHVALGELIKNGYDADATRVRVGFERNTIVVEDDGHGMTFDEFDRFWMRVGSTHKFKQGRSRDKHRSLTGSKGVGRLAVQFLARRLTLTTCAGDEEVEATVYWPDAARAGAELVETKVTVTRRPAHRSFLDSAVGTRLELQDLNHRWTSDDFRGLAREIWTLQPPFRASGATEGFEVSLETGDATVQAAFDKQLRAVLEIWTARLVGRVHRFDDGRREMRLTLEFSDGVRRRVRYEAPEDVEHLDFEIRVFNLVRRQPRGIRVGDAREYFNRFGGVHVYDAGFRLPYYGPDTDWLGVEQDHAHRLSKSNLLPDDLGVAGGMSFLPTNSRLFGVVNVNTGEERRGSGDPGQSLTISVTRDRLVVNAAYRELRRAVRWSLDFYAMQEAERHLAEDAQDVEALSPKRVRIQEVLERHREEIPATTYKAVTSELAAAIEAQEGEADRAARRAGLLGALATAGIAAVGFEHEISKQISLLEDIAEQLAAPGLEIDREATAVEILEWVERARATRRIFSFVMDPDSDEPRSMPANDLVATVVSQLAPLLRGMTIAQEVPPPLRLPAGRFAEWSAILQNLLINAGNATLDTDAPKVLIDGKTGHPHVLRVQDNGVGVNLETSEELFEPFVRRLELPPERRRSGLGGTGLGLTIVRMLARTLNCEVHFARPDTGFSTAVEISWQT